MPKIIGFEGADDDPTATSLLPATQMKMENCQPEAEKIILQFLQEYFKVFITNKYTSAHFENPNIENRN